MKHLTLPLAAALALPGTAAATEVLTAGMITISNPWARATPKGASVGAAYLTLSNKGTDTDRLVGVSSPSASSVEVHEMSMKNGVMSMRQVAGGVQIKPGQTVVLKPNSYHIM
jgi:copper(I)-binding protein